MRRLVQAASVALVIAASLTTSRLQGQTIYVCPDCGRTHNQPVSTVTGAVAPATPVTYTSNYSGNYSSVGSQITYGTPIASTPVYSSAPVAPASYSAPSVSYSSGGSGNVLAMLNSQRARSGVPRLNYDPTLQAVAQRRAQQMASMGTKGHPPGSFAPGRYEGVGWSSSFSPNGVSACYTRDPNMRYAGAAMATGRDGVYFVVVYR